MHPGGKPQGPSRGYTRGEGPVHGPVHVLELNVGVAVDLVESVSQELSSRATGHWASWGGRRQAQNQERVEGLGGDT